MDFIVLPTISFSITIIACLILIMLTQNNTYFKHIMKTIAEKSA